MGNYSWLLGQQKTEKVEAVCPCGGVLKVEGGTVYCGQRYREFLKHHEKCITAISAYHFYTPINANPLKQGIENDEGTTPADIG